MGMARRSGRRLAVVGLLLTADLGRQAWEMMLPKLESLLSD
jgi:hypothetical protein